jgi:hypothetical protein
MSVVGMVTQSILGARFGMGGPYKLALDPAGDVREPALAYMRLKARETRLKAAERYKILEGEPSDAEAAELEAMGDAVMLAEAAARSAMYATGHRWSVLAIEGRYLYLCRGVDDEGRKYDPSLRTGELSEWAWCKGCNGTGRQTYRPDLGKQKCFTCGGRGTYRLPLPETVRRAVDGEASRRAKAAKAAADAEMRAAAAAFDSEDETAEMEVAHVDA